MEINSEPVFCTHCNKMQTFYVLLEDKEWITEDNFPLKYYELTAVCYECNHEVYVPQINDMNVEHRNKLFEKFGGHCGTN